MFMLVRNQLPNYSQTVYWLRAGIPMGRSLSSSTIKNFHFSIPSRLSLGPTQIPLKWLLGGRGAVYQYVRQPGREPPTSTATKTHGSIYPFHVRAVVLWRLDKHIGNFSFTFNCLTEGAMEQASCLNAMELREITGMCR
jgi:hypothetical protein